MMFSCPAPYSQVTTSKKPAIWVESQWLVKSPHQLCLNWSRLCHELLWTMNFWAPINTPINQTRNLSRVSVSLTSVIFSLSSPLTVSLLSRSHTHSLFHSLSPSLSLCLCLSVCLSLSLSLSLWGPCDRHPQLLLLLPYLSIWYVYISWLRVKLDKATLGGLRMPSAEALSLTVIVN